LVKKLVELHDGKVTAHSPGINQGAEFTVRLPCLVKETAQMELGDQEHLPKAVAQGLKILLIDDNQDIVDSISVWLKMLGHQVKVASDGRQGLSVALEFKPDAIFLDIGLPEMDGYQIAKKLREQPDLQGTKVIALSGYTPNNDPNGGKMDFDHHLIKPLTLRQLQNLITNVLLQKSHRLD
jgi:CheY-like chemotaxis protein